MVIVFFTPKFSAEIESWLDYWVFETLAQAERLVNSRTWLTFTPEIVCCPVD